MMSFIIRQCIGLVTLAMCFQCFLCLPARRTEIAIPRELQQELIRIASFKSQDNDLMNDSVRVKRVPPEVAAKAMEIGGKLAEQTVDKLFDKIGEAGDRAAGYLENGASVDVQPQNGFASDDMFAPPAWHIEAGVGDAVDDEESGESYNAYPMGIGTVMLNGCWGSNYAPGDPCYKHRVPSQATCDNMIDGAAFIGVGFDVRGEYSPESRRMSLIQRNCAGFSSYDGYDVPDTMNVHGIYETRSTMMSFESRSEFSSYLQEEAGVSGSFLFFSAGVSSAYGRSVMSNQQQFMSLLDIDIVRYEIFKDIVTPSDLSTPFLKEYIDLPTSYMETGAPYKFQDFIQRWGTHYVTSGEFGGRLELSKVALASFYSSVEQFSMEAKVDYDLFFASYHAKQSKEGGSTNVEQNKFSSMNIKALGGHQDIAGLIADGGSPTSKTELMNWLNSIPDYPKPFKFTLAPITDLLHFQDDDLFPATDLKNCYERDDLQTDPSSGKKYYLVENTVANVTLTEKSYCLFESKEQFLREYTQKRKTLEKAISIYLSEGIVSKEEFTVPGGSSHCEIVQIEQPDRSKTIDWDYIVSGQPFSVMFDMEADIPGGFHGKSIPKDEVYQMRYFAGKWFVLDDAGTTLKLSDGYSNGGAGELPNRRISIEGLVLSYDAEANFLKLTHDDYTASKAIWPELYETFQERYLARIQWPISFDAIQKNMLNAAVPGVANIPCNVRWSNIQTFDLTASGICLYFTASSEGSIYVVLATVPKDVKTWYFVEITPSDASIHKYQYVLTETFNKNARGLGDSTLQQNYFVCVESKNQGMATVIEYGKFVGRESNRVIYLSYKDVHSPTSPMFYAFGSGSHDVVISHLNIYNREPPSRPSQCGAGTVFHKESNFCQLNCDDNCDPTYGCKIAETGIPSSKLCGECKTIRMTRGLEFECTDSCPISTIKVDAKQVCPCKWYKSECKERCPQGTEFHSETSECKEPITWRDDYRCGNDFPLPNGRPAECFRYGFAPCCSSTGWCGDTNQHCECESCIDYRKVTWRSDGRCGPGFEVNGKQAECNPDTDHQCCSADGWCGNTVDHCKCEGCIDYKHTLWRIDGRCGTDFPLADGTPAQCDPNAEERCCSTHGWCGGTSEHCNCDECINYGTGEIQKLWRDDNLCGSDYPLSDGSPAQCNPNGEGPCCSFYGWCGSSSEYCDCEGCVDYRKGGDRNDATGKKWRDDYQCGPYALLDDGITPAQCNPNGESPCCSSNGWCGSSEQYCSCGGCVDYRNGGYQNDATGKKWRDDYQCGPNVYLDDGITEAQCNPNGESPCCSPHGWCGSSSDYCNCGGCVDYRNGGYQNDATSKTWRDDYRCGPYAYLDDGTQAECNPNGESPCCSSSGWCGSSSEYCDCGGCVDYRNGGDRNDATGKKWRDDYQCGPYALLDDGITEAQCNPNGESPCCSPHGWCGSSSDYCNCGGCVDYRNGGLKRTILNILNDMLAFRSEGNGTTLV